jgi:hypothetical protein
MEILHWPDEMKRRLEADAAASPADEAREAREAA